MPPWPSPHSIDYLESVSTVEDSMPVSGIRKEKVFLLSALVLLTCTKQVPPPDPRVTPAVMPPPTPGNTVRGTATYREKIAMPSDAVFEATLEDVSRADAPAEVISRI